MRRAAHRRPHSGALRIEGTSAGALSFFHADGTPYGALLVPRQLAAPKGEPPRQTRTAEVVSALRGLGFRAAEARRAVKQVLDASDTAHVGDGSESTHVGLEAQLRAALALLTPR